MSEKNTQKRFDEWEVDCNTCERYWLNQCDGAKCGSEAKKQPCRSYFATRSVVIPEQIKTLEKGIFRLKIATCVLAAVVGVVLTTLLFWLI
jgi:hypothetical protein